MSAPDKSLICALLDRWIRQRPGLEFGNYGDVSAYRSELRSITRQLHDARILLGYVEGHDGITAEQIIAAFPRAYSGRLKLEERFRVNGLPKTFPTLELAQARAAEFLPAIVAIESVWSLDYCTGQYWPTEYRAAACAVLASVLWDYYRENMPAPVAHRVESWGKWDGSQFNHERSEPLGIHAACELLNEKGGQEYGHISDLFRDGEGRPRFTAGDYLRHSLKRQFGRSIQKRWLA